MLHADPLVTPSSAEGHSDPRELLSHAAHGLATWHRALPADLGVALDTWARRGPSRFDTIVTLPRYSLAAATRGLAAPARRWLTSDIALLLARLAQMSESRRLRVSFGVVDGDQCRKFHVDHVRYRLVTTYLGPGTEWVPDHAVARDALDHPADCPCEANEDIVRDPTAVRHAIAGDVLVMKGARHPQHRGVVHRSPPIEGTGQLRVVLAASTTD